ncbi:MAG: GNAT family N-acetyltransferase [Alphaproteobacteria bacterium]
MTLDIAPYGERDRSALVDFAAAVQDFERAFTPSLRPGADIGVAYIDYLLDRARQADGLVLVAREDARPVGFIAGWIEVDNDWLVEEAARRHGYVSDLFVVEDRRRRGIARALMEAVEAALREKGCRRLRICSKALNAGAIAAYRRAGYAPYEVILDKMLD